MAKTFAEKILGAKAGKAVVPGEIVEVSPDFAMSHDNTAAISKTFAELGLDKIDDPARHVIFLDHCVPAANDKFAENHKVVREFVQKQKIQHFYDINRGVCHQAFAEEGFALPGTLIVGSDSHSTTYGAFGAFATGIGRSEMAVIFATGKIWLRVPESIKITLTGTAPEGISSKDMMLYILGQLGADGALYKSVWFTGPVVSGLSIDSRMVFPNMAVEMGAKNGYIEPDDMTIDYLRSRSKREYEIVTSDLDAVFENEYSFEISSLEPQIARPHTVDNVCSISAVKGTPVNQIFFGSCTNARLEDFEIVARVLKGKKIHKSTRMIVSPASQQIFIDALRLGYVESLADAGAVIVNSGCGPCMGSHLGIPAPGEVVLSTSNRNFRGRFGCKEAEIYLSSPLTAAASALTGKITDFREVL